MRSKTFISTPCFKNYVSQRHFQAKLELIPKIQLYHNMISPCTVLVPSS